MVFFAILNAWINFWLYRLMAFVQMAGPLTIAAGAQRAMLDGDFRAIVIGYVIMRVAMASQWMRAAISDPGHRGACVRYAVGIVVVQALWVTWWLTHGPVWLFPILALVDLSVSPIAERHHGTAFHRHHIAERYGLFTLIVLGESILAVTNSIIGSMPDADERTGLILIALCSLVIVAAMWWIYFDRPQHDQMITRPRIFLGLSALLHLRVGGGVLGRGGSRDLGATAREPPEPHRRRLDADDPARGVRGRDVAGARRGPPRRHPGRWHDRAHRRTGGHRGAALPVAGCGRGDGGGSCSGQLAARSG